MILNFFLILLEIKGKSNFGSTGGTGLDDAQHLCFTFAICCNLIIFIVTQK